MRAAWRLAISSLFARRSRTFLLVGVVAMATMLISAVGVAMGSLRHAVRARVDSMVGAADVRVKGTGGASTIPRSMLDVVRNWEGVERAQPRLEAPLSLRFGKPSWRRPEGQEFGSFLRVIEQYQAPMIAYGVDDASAATLIKIEEGRTPRADDEVVLDRFAIKRLSERPKSAGMPGSFSMAMFARGSGTSGKQESGPTSVESEEEAQRWNAWGRPVLGDTVELVQFGEKPRRLTIVGVAAQPPLGGRARAYMTMDGLSKAANRTGRLTQIDIVLKEGVEPAEFVERYAGDVPKGVLVQTSEKITSGLDRNLQVNQMAFLLATLMSCIAAGFIITTGMSTGVVERLRELAILRCIGATRRTLAGTQILQGIVIAIMGACIGVPLGVAAAAIMIWYYRDRLQAPLHLDVWRVGVSVGGALLAGLVGASWPAWRASRVAPLEALASRAKPVSRRTLVIISVCGALGVLVHLSIFTLLKDRDAVFFSYISVGLPCLMVGYFLLGVPAVLAASRLLGPSIERLFGVPRNLAVRSVERTPYRFGFTAGALMAGLAMMVAIWTQGGAAMRDWVGKLQFPDAFAVGLAMPPEAQEALRQLPFVSDTCAISLHPVTTESFGVSGLTKIKTSFVAFEPDAFFRMTKVVWVQGDEQTARRRLDEGGAVLVTREFLVARNQGVGSTFVCWDDQDQRHEFEIVGVVASPGLEVADDIFDVGEDFTQQRVHAVFGNRRDLRERFHTDTIGLLQFSLREGVDDEEAMGEVRATLAPFGVLSAGSGRQLKQTITDFVRTTLFVSSCVAVFAMLVASFGVANLIVAGVQARTFEFGVLRALGGMGGAGGVLTRLVLAELAMLVIAACVLGSLMGVQGAFGGLVLNRLVWGLDMSLRPPWLAIASGWGVLALIALIAAGPTVIALAKKTPRDLLGAMRG